MLNVRDIDSLWSKSYKNVSDVDRLINSQVYDPICDILNGAKKCLLNLVK